MGTAAHLALVAALEAEDASHADVEFEVLAAGEHKHDKERALGHGTVSLHELLAKGEDATDVAINLRDERRGHKSATVGKLQVTVKALKALRRADKTINARRLHATRQLAAPVPVIPIGEGAFDGRAATSAPASWPRLAAAASAGRQAGRGALGSAASQRGPPPSSSHRHAAGAPRTTREAVSESSPCSMPPVQTIPMRPLTGDALARARRARTGRPAATHPRWAPSWRATARTDVPTR